MCISIWYNTDFPIVFWVPTLLNRSIGKNQSVENANLCVHNFLNYFSRSYRSRCGNLCSGVRCETPHCCPNEVIVPGDSDCNCCPRCAQGIYI